MKVLFVGFGSIAKKHYDALKTLHPEAIVYALRSSPESKTIPDVANVYSWESLPESLNFAIVSNPTFKHVEAIKILIEKNIPLFIEKPLSDRLDELESIEKKIIQKKLKTYVACNLRFLSSLKYMKNEILSREPRINEVSIYCGSYLPEWRPGKNFREIYSSYTEMGGGVHLDLFHELDYACWLFGIPIKSYNIQRSVSSLNIASTDFAAFQLFYPNFVASITLNYYRKQTKREIEIVSDDCIYVINLLSNSISDGKGNLIFSDEKYNVGTTYIDQMSFFLNMLKGAAEPMNTFSESLKILKICLPDE